MHVNKLAITLLAAHNCCHDNKLILKDEVADTSFILPARSRQVEFQGGGNLDKAQE
jgi:hypothetical protein